MLNTRLCEVLEIDVPIIQAAIWPATSPELVAAVGEAGAIGSIGAVFASAERLSGEIAAVRALTRRPFIVNHVVPQLNEEAFQATLDAEPAAVSFALGDPGPLVDRAHGAGAKVIHQVHTVAQAREAAERGVDVIIAQGSEAGGQGMAAGPGVMALVPQVADAVEPIPVAAAGGVADGRGLAAALALGAQGANVGTRFLASEEASSDGAWKERIVAAASEDAVRFEAWRELFPPTRPGAYDVVPRVLRTPFVERLEQRPQEARVNAEELRSRVTAAVVGRTTHELVPFTGQTAGLIDDVRPAREIVERMVHEAEEALERAAALRGSR
jgi:nitronate monooxygenase/enoyl-[acyl-carrier protein] reductase II